MDVPVVVGVVAVWMVVVVVVVVLVVAVLVSFDSKRNAPSRSPTKHHCRGDNQDHYYAPGTISTTTVTRRGKVGKAYWRSEIC